MVTRGPASRMAWLAVLAFCLIPGLVLGDDLPTAKPEEVGVSSEKVEKLSTFMQSLVDDGKIAGGVTMMARHGKVIHLKAVGMADREEKKAMQTNSIFRIASMSKPITSVAIMRLYEQGKVGLDDPVSKYIPEFKNPQVLVNVDPFETESAQREITIRHLLTHTSGLGYTQTPRIGPIYVQHGILTGLCSTELTLDEMVRKAAGLPVQFEPGSQWLYGMSTDVLGRVVEVASGKTFDTFIREDICEPLGMTDTFFTAPHEKQSRVVEVYIPKDGRIEKLAAGEKRVHGGAPVSSDYHLDCNNYFSGGGGLCSTASDYMRFCQMLLNGGELEGRRLLRKDTVKMMTVNQLGEVSIPDPDSGPDLIDTFGLGFTIYDDQNAHEQLKGAYAWFGFWSTSFRVSPRGNWILVTMSQLAWDEKTTPAWFAEYEQIAADSIMDGTSN